VKAGVDVFAAPGGTAGAEDASTAFVSDAVDFRPNRSSSSFALRRALPAVASRSASSASRRNRAFSAALCISADCGSTGRELGTEGEVVDGVVVVGAGLTGGGGSVVGLA